MILLDAETKILFIDKVILVQMGFVQHSQVINELFILIYLCKHCFAELSLHYMITGFESRLEICMDDDLDHVTILFKWSNDPTVKTLLEWLLLTAVQMVLILFGIRAFYTLPEGSFIRAEAVPHNSVLMC